MTHLSYSFTGKNAFWRYIVMIGALFIAANTVGGIPLIIGFITKATSDPSAISNFASNPSDLRLLGIDQNLMLFMMLFPFLIGLVTFIILIRPLHARNFMQAFTGAPSLRWNRILVSAFIWTAFSVLYFLIYMWIEPSNFRLNNLSSSLIWLTVISLLFIPFQAAFEEIIFRGYLMQGFTALTVPLRITSTAVLPVIITSVLFGIMHAWNPEIKVYGFLTMIPQYVLFGLLFGVITVLDNGIEIATGAHAANNIFLSIFVTNSSSTLQTPAVFEQLSIRPWIEFWALLGTSLLFYSAMKFIFKMKGISTLWKEIKSPSGGAQMP